MRSSTRRPASILTAFAVASPPSSPPAAAPRTSPAPPRRRRRPEHGGHRGPEPREHEPVTIVVGALRPGVTQEAVDALYQQIGEFQAKYPWITVEPEEYNWTAPTFTAALAGGTLPDVFTIPFTDGKGLIANHQIVDIDARVRALGYADKFNPNVLVNGQDADGKIFAVPTAAYGMSLTYNRSLFTAAGLDPNKPADDVGRGPHRGQDHRRQDRRRRLRPDGDREHRRLAADHLDLCPRRPDGGGRRRRQGHRDPQQRQDQGRPAAPQGHALGRQLHGLHVRLRVGHDEPGLRGRPGRHVHRRLGPLHLDGPERGLKPDDYGIT